MEDISLHILDVAENGITAGASLIKIAIEEDTREDLLKIRVEDNGKGMDEEFLAKVLDPFVTTRTTRKVGLGLSLFRQSAQEAEGDLYVESRTGKGTTVSVIMSHSHIDRKPMGNMAETLVTLIEGNPDVDFAYSHVRDGRQYDLDTRTIRAELEEIPLNDPQVIGLIRDDIVTGIAELDAQA
ncbi:MAG: ATP-binding protein [Thermodesulfobacteriota bacterium]